MSPIFLQRGSSRIGQSIASRAKGVQSVVEARLNSILKKLIDCKPLSTEEAHFVNSTQFLSIITILTDAIITGNQEEIVATLVGPVSAGFSWLILDDLYRSIENMLKEIDETLERDASTGQSKRCDMQVFAPAKDKFTILQGRVNHVRAALQKSYQAQIEAYQMQLQTQSYHQRLSVEAIRKEAGASS